MEERQEEITLLMPLKKRVSGLGITVNPILPLTKI